MISTLRPYQDRGIANIRAAYASGSRSVLAVAPTGSGKTVMFSFVSAAAAKLGRRVAILVHRDSLLTQASRSLTECGVEHGIIAPGHSTTTDAIQIASVQTLVRRLDRYQAFDLLVVDEAHHATAGTWLKIIAANPNAHVLGVTATPCRADGTGLDEIFETMVLGPSIQELIDDGYLVDSTVYAPSHLVDLSRVRTRAGDYDRAELSAAMDSGTVTGDAVAHYTRLCPGRPAVAFCVSVQHAKDVAASFSAAGYRAAAISGKTPLEQIRASIDGLSTGAVQVLASCDLISEGTDVPALTAAILLRPTQSEGLFIQQVGRALRPVGLAGNTAAERLASIAASSKPKAIILDHSGNVFKHGMPTEERDWTLEGRKRRAGKAGVPFPVRQCKRCFACHRPAPVCPQCGFAYPDEGRTVVTETGELVLVDDAAPARRAVALKKRIKAAKTLEDFHAIARDYSFKPGWASIRYQITSQYRARYQSQ